MGALRAAAAPRSLAHFAALAGQLGLFVAVLHQFNLESPAFRALTLLAVGGWSIHYFLPPRYRLGFFVALSLAGIALVFGKPWEGLALRGLMDGAWIVAIGLGLIGLCHLPVRLSWRVAVLLAVAGGLIAARAGLVAVPWSAAIWPVLAAMFMFRLIVYLYQVRHEKTRIGLDERLAYFFMLPNVCFPLFPVVDFQTFRRTYYDDPDRHRIYQTGIQWLFRGAFHLILYRLAYQNLVLDAAEVSDRADLAQFLLWPFLLYLRVSGTFHIITGLLHLFGFNLPETHKLYFLAASFTDFWRRINIYWKDFLLKVFYYPFYFRLRRFGETAAVVAATLLAFLVTWVLHNYQWFWLRGTWVFTWNDFVFWMALAVLVAGNSLVEMRRGRARRLPGRVLPWRRTLTVALKTLGVYVTISLLWSLWNARSLGEWFAVLGAAAVPSADDSGLLLALALAALLLGAVAAVNARGAVTRPYTFARSAAGVAVPALLALLLSLPAIHTRLGGAASAAIASATNSELNRRDFANFERGYYENLLDVGGFNPELWNVYGAKPADWVLLQDSPLAERTGSLPGYVLRPSVEAEFHGAIVRTNRWGMRDKDYERTPPANTLRIALLGASHVFGSGVANDETFENILEERLNREAADGEYARYEILNFAVAGYSTSESLVSLEDRVLGFDPDYVFYFEHAGAARGEVPDVKKFIRNGTALRYDFFRVLASEIGIGEGTDDDQLLSILTTHSARILKALYMRLVEVAHNRDVPILWIHLPRTHESGAVAAAAASERSLAREAGFITLDLSGVYDGHERDTLEVAPWDEHPNALAHRLIAAKLYEVLRASPDSVPLGLPTRLTSIDEPTTAERGEKP